MGLVLKSKGSQIELEGGYAMLFKIRSRVAMAWDKEFGEHYKTSLMCISKDNFKEFDKRTNEILKKEIFKNEDEDLIDFFFASNCGGKCRYRISKKIYDLIKAGYAEDFE